MFEDFRRLFRHSLTYGIGRSANKLASFLILPIILRYLTPEDYGILEIFTVTVSILTTVLGLGMESAIFRYYYQAESPEKKKRLLSSSLWGMILTSIPLIVIITLWSGTFSKYFWNSAIYTSFFVVIFITIGLNILKTIPLATLRAKEESIKYTIFTLIGLFSVLFFNLYFVVVLKKSIFGILLGNMIGGLIGLIILILAIRRDIGFIFSTQEFKQLVKFGLPITTILISYLIINVSDRFFLKHFSTMSEVGCYALGYRFGILIHVLLVEPFNMAWKPFAMSVVDKENAKDIYSTTLTYFLFVALLMWLGLSVFSKDIIQIIAPPSYWRAYTVIPIVALAYLFLGISYNVSVGLYIREKTKYYPYVAAISVIMNLLLNWLLIPRWGMMGAAIATLISYITMAALMYGMSMHFFAYQYEFGRILKLILVCGGLCVLFYVIPTQALLLNLSIGIIIIIGFPLILYFSGFLHRNEVDRIKLFLAKNAQDK